MKEIHLGNRTIGHSKACYIIAEIGLNHNGKEGLAVKLAEEAVKAGADAVKLSRFDTLRLMAGSPDTLGLSAKAVDGSVPDLTKLSQPFILSDETLTKIALICKKHGVGFLSTPFDEERVDFLVQLGVPAIKIASGDLTDDPFLKYIAAKRIPVILSTGMSSLEEVRYAVKLLEKNGCPELALLHCVSGYPAKPEELNLRAIATLAKEFDIPIGFSDHTLGVETASIAVAAGACIIEKHFTLNKELPGPDQRFSLDSFEFSQMIQKIRATEMMLGVAQKKPTTAELEYRKFGRRSIVAKVAIAAGTVITEEMLAMKRPGTGISPKDFYKVVGRKSSRHIAENAILSWDDLL